LSSCFAEPVSELFEDFFCAVCFCEDGLSIDSTICSAISLTFSAPSLIIPLTPFFSFLTVFFNISLIFSTPS